MKLKVKALYNITKVLGSSTYKISKFIYPYGKKAFGIAGGAVTGSYDTFLNTYFLFAGDKGITKHEQKLLKICSKFRKKRKELLAKTPYIDSAVISGLTITEMVLKGVPTDVERAFQGAYPEVAENVSFIEAWTGYLTHEERLGFLNGIKGKLFEIKYVDHLNAEMEPGYFASIADLSNQKGWDIQINGPDNEIIDLIQLKATQSISYINQTLEAYPNIDIVTLADLKNELILADVQTSVTASDITNTELLSEISEATAGGLNFISLGMGLSYIIFSSYKRKDLNNFQQDMMVGERAVNLFISWGIIGSSGLGLAGIPVIMIKDWLLKKGKSKRKKRVQMKEEHKTLSLAFKNWDRRMSRRNFLKSLLVAPAIVKISLK